MEEKEILLTQEGYDNLEKELDYLKTEERAAIAERIRVALGFGDLSENSEYDEAKNAQAANENKIADLENKIRHARIIDESEIDTKTVQIGDRKIGGGNPKLTLNLLFCFTNHCNFTLITSYFFPWNF